MRPNAEETYLFVDGEWLKGTLRDLEQKWFHSKITVDYDTLRSATNASKAFYYDAMPPMEIQHDQKRRRKLIELRSISAHSMWHVIEGVARPRGKRVKRSTGAAPSEGGYLQQKGVDVQLALDAVAHRYRGNYKKIVLIAGDMDFLPLVKLLVEMGTTVEVWCDPTKTPSELFLAADEKEWISIRSVYPAGFFRCSGPHPKDPVWEPGRPNFNGDTELVASSWGPGTCWTVHKTDTGGVVTKMDNDSSHWKHNDPEIQCWYLKSMYPDLVWDDPPLEI